MLEIGTSVGLVMKYAEHGTLSDALQRNDSLLLQYWKKFRDQIEKGLNFLHRIGIVHGDLKSSNILLFKESHDPYAKVTT